MSLTIQQIEEQISKLQENLNNLKNEKLKISRKFTGQYFEPYCGKIYRRMESNKISIWETYIQTKNEWILMESKESKEMEKLYQQYCVSTKKTSQEDSVATKKTPQENLEEFMS